MKLPIISFGLIIVALLAIQVQVDTLNKEQAAQKVSISKLITVLEGHQEIMKHLVQDRSLTYPQHWHVSTNYLLTNTVVGFIDCKN